MNLLDMYKRLTEEEKKEFIKLIIKEIKIEKTYLEINGKDLAESIYQASRDTFLKD